MPASKSPPAAFRIAPESRPRNHGRHSLAGRTTGEKEKVNARTVKGRKAAWSAAYIGIGANLGDRRRTIRQAIGMLNRTPGVRAIGVSRLIETEPVGGPKRQPMFLNGAAKILTRLEPGELLDLLLDVERRLGRDRSREVRNGPRPIDLDLLLYGSRVLRGRRLTVPHPRMHLRMFVLKPMSEIAPRVRHPLIGITMASLAARLAAKVGRRLERKARPR